MHLLVVGSCLLITQQEVSVCLSSIIILMACQDVLLNGDIYHLNNATDDSLHSYGKIDCWVEHQRLASVQLV